MHLARLVLLNNVKKELRFERSLAKTPEFFSHFIRKHGLVEKTSRNLPFVHLFKQSEDFSWRIEIPYRRPKPEEKPDPIELDVLGPIEEKKSNRLMNEDSSLFFISVSNNSSFHLNLECFTYQSTIWLQDMMFSDSCPGRTSKLFPEKINYPNYNTLNENLQQCLVDWLQSVGITEDYAKFIELRSLYKEKELYDYWLESIKNFTEID